MDKKIYKPNEFAKLVGVSQKTLQRWDTSGKLISYRTPSDRRFYTQEQLNECMGIQPEVENKVNKIVIYCRVSGVNQKEDLKNQVEFLQTYVNAKGIIVDEIITDIGSGLNYKRKNWNELIDSCLKGEIKTIFITYSDRFIRFGFEWFELLLKKYGTEIIVVNNVKLSPQEELVQDLISIIHVFSCKIYGLRKYKKKVKEDEEIVKSLQNRD